MIKKISKLIIIASALFFSKSFHAQTPGTLTFTFTEVAKAASACYNGNAQHVLAAWIQNTTGTGTGTFVKTKLRYVGSGTSDHLPTWATNASCTSGIATSTGCNTIDGTTGATRSAWNTYTVTWDGKKGATSTGTLQPDGVYKVSIQSTWNHGTTGTAITSYTFTKGPSIDHQTPIGNSTFTNVVLHWAPSITTGIEESNLVNPQAQVYPNPTNDVFNINYSKANNITVINTLGFVIYDEKLDILTAGTKTIDLTNFSNGIYFVNVSNNDGSSRHKIILDK